MEGNDIRGVTEWKRKKIYENGDEFIKSGRCKKEIYFFKPKIS
jgi:hypothetical protein